MTLAFAPERIEHWPLARLQPYAKNAKMHGPDQVARIAASMAEFYKHCLAWEQQSVRRKTALPFYLYACLTWTELMLQLGGACKRNLADCLGNVGLDLVV